MAFEKKSLISSRNVTQKAIVASNATPLSSKVTTDPKVASVRMAKAVNTSKQLAKSVNVSRAALSKSVNVSKAALSKSVIASKNLAKNMSVSKSVTKRVAKSAL